MSRLSMIFKLTIFTILLAFLSASNGFTNEDQESLKDAEAAMKQDKSGTNPVNFTFDTRLYNEYIWLNTAGDGYQNITTFEFKMPFADGKWQFRTRIRGTFLEADLTGDGIDEVDESGLGDIDFRFLTIPYINMEKTFALAIGLETFLDTASEDALGSGATSLGPQLFTVFFNPLGIKGMLFAPAYQHKFSVDVDDGREDVHQGLIDLYVVWISPTKQYWSIFDPQIILDYEQDIEYSIIDLEVGTMLDRWFDTKGHSVYLRPSIGIGGERLTDGSIEFGYKFIW